MENNEKLLALRRKDGIAEFEKYLSDPELGSCILKLPDTVYEGGSMGRVVSLAQLIATWANRSDSAKFTRYAEPENNLVEFVSSLHGLFAVYFCDQFIGSQMQLNLRHKALSLVGPKIIAMYQRDFYKIRKGRRIELLSVLHAKHEFLPAFYKDKPTISDLKNPQAHGQLIASEKEMDGLFQSCMFCMSPYPRSRPITKLLLWSNAVGTLLHEAFRNTAEHAYLTPQQQKRRLARKGIRGLLIQNSRLPKTSLSDYVSISSGYSNAKDYLEKLMRLERGYERQTVDMLEISIFDTGPGFAETMRSACASDQSSNGKLVKKCFEPYQTSKLGSSSGLGLSRILTAVKKLNGFFRCRTSTCEVVFSSIDEIDNGFGNVHIKDGLADVVGTTVTVCIPFAY